MLRGGHIGNDAQLREAFERILQETTKTGFGEDDEEGEGPGAGSQKLKGFMKVLRKSAKSVAKKITGGSREFQPNSTSFIVDPSVLREFCFNFPSRCGLERLHFQRLQPPNQVRGWKGNRAKNKEQMSFSRGELLFVN